ncbi:luciferin 4-monooxygenase-like [Drosophila bipectinata]|uniref:luciferin 4-monooxygenase-like n=1 Tax=Drosophila bipectinata TaxID=42026 RepID=UPI001C89B19C|nr:luciferin 4-monooxygenase-like [Drosophila bipectinata]
MEIFPTTYDTRNRIWSGSKRSSIYKEETSLGQIICNTMRNFPKNVFQINDIDGVTVNFEQGILWAIRMAQIFKKRGLKHSDVIGIAARNSTYVTPLGVACLFNTTPFHAVNPTYDEGTTNHVFSITKPSLIFCDGQDYQKILAATIAWKPEIFTVTEPLQGVPHIDSLLNPTPTELFYQPEPLKEGGGQTVAILCSSGTTGLPKAVCLSNRCLVKDSFIFFNNETVTYSASGLDWYSGLISYIMSTTIGCTRVITNRPFSAEYFVQLVEKYKISYVNFSPRHLSALVNCPAATKESLASLKVITYGGSISSLDTQKRLQKLVPNCVLISGYGFTEGGGVLTAGMGLKSGNSVGKPMRGVKIRIVDDDGKFLTYNEVGEIYVNTGLPWNGYYGNPLETQLMQDCDGWFHSGDLGYFNEQNLLFIVDRKKEILKFQGNQYWPSEIEATISELAQVEEVSVVGIYDEKNGDSAGALVVKKKGATITEQEIIDHVAKRLPAVYKHLHAGVEFTEDLPANPNGKTDKRAAREEFLRRKSAAA